MNNSPRLWISALLAGAMLLAPAGCKKEEDEKEDRIETGIIQVLPVGEAERARAQGEVNKIWSDPEIVARVKACAPAAEDENFYRDLVVLTRHAHRLAGHGLGRSRNIGGGSVRVFEDAPGSLWAGHYVASRLKAIGVELVPIQEFPVPQLITTECSLVVDGKEYSVHKNKDGTHSAYDKKGNLLCL